eukprot:8548853-Heterocapsa_arctica.AAC.1
MSPGSIRARNTDIKLSAGVARIMTANATSLADWLGLKIMGGRRTVPNPTQRKSITFVITKKLCSQRWRDAVSSSAGVDSTVADATAIMTARMQAELPLVVAPPAPATGLWGCPLRRA